MVNAISLIAGVILYIFIVLDIIKTTLSTNGGGPLTNLLSRGTWQLFFRLAGKDGRHKLLEYAGTAVLVFILISWVAGLWIGLFLVLFSDTNSVVNSDTKLPADALEKFYFAGFTLSTLGVGDFIASNDFWRLLTTTAGFSGLAFITVSITYFVPVLSAVALQGKLSLFISSMGKTPQQVLLNSWNSQNFSSFFNTVPDLSQLIYQHTLNHHSYPVIHYFHNTDPQVSITIAMVILDETRRILKQDLDEATEPEKLRLTMLQTALDKYLEMMKQGYIQQKSDNAGPLPDLQALKQAGIQVKETASTELPEQAQERRKLLSATLEKDGWTWKEIFAVER